MKIAIPHADISQIQGSAHAKKIKTSARIRAQRQSVVDTAGRCNEGGNSASIVVIEERISVYKKGRKKPARRNGPAIDVDAVQNTRKRNPVPAIEIGRPMEPVKENKRNVFESAQVGRDAVEGASTFVKRKVPSANATPTQKSAREAEQGKQRTDPIVAVVVPGEVMPVVAARERRREDRLPRNNLTEDDATAETKRREERMPRDDLAEDDATAETKRREENAAIESQKANGPNPMMVAAKSQKIVNAVKAKTAVVGVQEQRAGEIQESKRSVVLTM